MAITIRDLAAWKAAGTRFVMLTAYDYPTARLLAEAEVPVLLVGDTLADNVLGYANTLPVTMTEMLHHARAVARGAPEQLLVGDLPFGAYQRSCARRRSTTPSDFLKAGMHAVKLEGGGWVGGHGRAPHPAGDPGDGTPRAHPAVGQRIRWSEGPGAGAPSDRERLLADAHALQDAGAFALVLEGIPRDLAAQVTARADHPHHRHRRRTRLRCARSW